MSRIGYPPAAPPTDLDPRGPLRTAAEAEAYVAGICFKTGPPERIGVELEWTVHDAANPSAPLVPAVLRDALGTHAPPTLDPRSPHDPLPHGGVVTVEPGGQVEISTPPVSSLSDLRTRVDADVAYLDDRLAPHGLRLGDEGIDPYREPRRLLRTPRYDAMARAFDRENTGGRVMMCSTAGLQVCLDAGDAGPDGWMARWAALHALGPVLIAAFANSPRRAGRATGWASTRMGSWLAIDPRRSWPVPQGGDPRLAWAGYALRAPLLCLRRPDADWHAPPGVTFADWLSGALSGPPTVDDLDYHLGTLFPPVRPRGYLEVRYIDAQPPGEWLAPVAVLAALLGDARTLDAARDLTAPVAGRWLAAARSGLADPALSRAARDVLDLACRHLAGTGLTAADRAAVTTIVQRRLDARGCPPAGGTGGIR